jgi:hypothetical protein
MPDSLLAISASMEFKEKGKYGEYLPFSDYSKIRSITTGIAWVL